MIATIGELEQVDGSSSLQFGETKVITSVTGPIEVSRMKNEKPTQAFLDINIRPASGVPTTREATLEAKLDDILQAMINVKQYPRQQLQIVVQIQRAGEPLSFTVLELSAIVNSVYLSLLDSGISLKSSFLATSCVITQKGEVVLKPDGNQLAASKSHHFVVYSLKNAKADELIFAESFGSFSEEELFTVYDKCATDIESQNVEIRKIVADSVKKDYTWKA
ncbi:unnamed protein product [Ambrosiozyma monospora]|uniref:Unnamed protein product n=1 Tax=Ambrosiozyma monospora TaxID=43982 RepID=A0A9W7DK38_AMBMO|nr:unnamed protein product [Ambrosiozyma monospora]